MRERKNLFRSGGGFYLIHYNLHVCQLQKGIAHCNSDYIGVKRRYWFLYPHGKEKVKTMKSDKNLK